MDSEFNSESDSSSSSSSKTVSTVTDLSSSASYDSIKSGIYRRSEVFKANSEAVDKEGNLELNEDEFSSESESLDRYYNYPSKNTEQYVKVHASKRRPLDEMLELSFQKRARQEEREKRRERRNIKIKKLFEERKELPKETGVSHSHSSATLREADKGTTGNL